MHCTIAIDEVRKVVKKDGTDCDASKAPPVGAKFDKDGACLCMPSESEEHVSECIILAGDKSEDH